MVASGVRGELIAFAVIIVLVLGVLLLGPAAWSQFGWRPYQWPDSIFIACLPDGIGLAGGVIVVAIRATYSPGSAWRERVASYPGWGLIAFSTTAMVCALITHLQPNIEFAAGLVPPAFLAISQVLVWSVRHFTSRMIS